MAQVVEIFTDGACRGNPGPGGWAALLRYGEAERAISGAEPHTTNNRMELTAAIEGLAALKRGSRVVLTTDSQYVRQGITQWMADWKRRGWRRADRQPVLNQDLWQRLDSLNATHEVRWEWVKGHSGHAENEAVDRAANAAIDAMLESPQPGSARGNPSQEKSPQPGSARGLPLASKSPQPRSIE